jgi:hypothetical protein
MALAEAIELQSAGAPENFHEGPGFVQGPNLRRLTTARSSRYHPLLTVL